MGRLFWKFFFSYWAALLASVVAVSAAGWIATVTLGEAGLPVEIGPRADFLLNFSASTLRHGGTAALRGVMEDWQRHASVILYVVDEEGHDLLGREVPTDSLARARSIVEADPTAAGARRVPLADGTSYVLFIPVAHRPLFERILFPSRLPYAWLPWVTGIVASLCFGAPLAWYVSRPIRHLRRAFAALAEGR